MGSLVLLATIAIFCAGCTPLPPPTPPTNQDGVIEIVEPPPSKEERDMPHRPRPTCPPGMVGSC